MASREYLPIDSCRHHITNGKFLYKWRFRHVEVFGTVQTLVCMVAVPVTVQASRCGTLCVRIVEGIRIDTRIVNGKLFEPGRATEVH